MSAPRWAHDATPGNHGHVLLPDTPDVLDPKATAVMLVAYEQMLEDGRVTVGGIADECGYSKSTVFERLQVLRKRGLLTWVPERHATIVPRVRVVR